MTFQKGQSGNPSGRAKKTPELLEVEALARKHGPDAIKALSLWAKSKNPAAAVAACKALLDRGFGMPKQTTDIRITERMVVEAPNKAADADEWAGQHSPVH